MEHRHFSASSINDSKSLVIWSFYTHQYVSVHIKNRKFLSGNFLTRNYKQVNRNKLQALGDAAYFYWMCRFVFSIIIKKEGADAMKEFMLTDIRERQNVNLLKYKKQIVQVIEEVIEDTLVVVETNRFVILQNNITNEEVRNIRSKQAKVRGIKNSCVNHPILFIGRKLSKNDAREYVLADVDYRESEDLRNYKKIIHETINEMITGAKVIVRENKYTIYKPITSGQARRIGRSLALTELSEFAHRRAVLFEGREVAETRY